MESGVGGGWPSWNTGSDIKQVGEHRRKTAHLLSALLSVRFFIFTKIQIIQEEFVKKVLLVIKQGIKKYLVKHLEYLSIQQVGIFCCKMIKCIK